MGEHNNQFGYIIEIIFWLVVVILAITLSVGQFLFLTIIGVCVYFGFIKRL